MTTRFPHGVSGNDPNDPILGNLPITAPQSIFVDFNDFAQTSSNWETAANSQAWPYSTNISGTGFTNITATNESNGAVTFNCGADATAVSSFAGRNRAFEFLENGKPIWFEALFYISTPSDLANCQMFVGISNSTSTPPPTDDGIYFIMSPGGELAIECHHNLSLTFSEVVGQVELDVEQKVGFYFDGVSLIWAYQGAQVGRAVIDPSDFPLGPLGIWCGLQNVAVDSNQMRLDYYMVAQERVII